MKMQSPGVFVRQENGKMYHFTGTVHPPRWWMPWTLPGYTCMHAGAKDLSHSENGNCQRCKVMTLKSVKLACVIPATLLVVSWSLVMMAPIAGTLARIIFIIFMGMIPTFTFDLVAALAKWQGHYKDRQ